MKFGHFDDDAREYVITTPRTPLPWINYLGSETSLALSPTRRAATVFTRTPSCAASPATGIITYLRILTAAITILKRAAPSGTPAGSPPRPSWIFTSAATVWVTASSPAKRITWPRGWSCSYPWARPGEIDRLVLTNESGAPKSFTVFSYVESVCGTPWTIPPTTSATSPPARSRWRAARSTTRPNTASAATTTRCTPSTRR